MIVFEEVRKVYEPRIVALRDASFVIEKGEFVFLVGPSGSGKSTIMRLLLKELEPTSGRIIVGGRELGRLKNSKVPMLRRNIGCVFQDFKLLHNRSAAENIAYALKVQGESNRAIRTKVPEVLALVGLSETISLLTSFPVASSSAFRSRAFVNHRLPHLRRAHGTSTRTRRSGSCSSSTASTVPDDGRMATTTARWSIRCKRDALTTATSSATARGHSFWSRNAESQAFSSRGIPLHRRESPTTVAATMTVLITISARPYRPLLPELVDRPRPQGRVVKVSSSNARATEADQRTRVKSRATRNGLVCLQGRALKRMTAKYPRSSKACRQPLPDAFEVTPNDANQVPVSRTGSTRSRRGGQVDYAQKKRSGSSRSRT
jgi:ABC-type uncharacterized transport system YnjBCD ATPase subunit